MALRQLAGQLIPTGIALCVALAGWVLSAQGAEITVTPPTSGRLYVVIRGEIALGDDETFRRLVIEMQPAGVILESEGGRLLPALEIGKMIRVQGMETLIAEGRVCTSSCALIWLAGMPRTMSETSRVGFHASYQAANGRLEETGVGNAMVGHYLSLLNLPERAVIFSTSAPPTEIRWLNANSRTLSGIDFKLTAASPPSEQNSEGPSSTRNKPFSWNGPPSWSVFQLKKGCALTLSFDSEKSIPNKSMLTIILERGDSSAILMVANQKFRSLVVEKEYQIETVFLKGDHLDNGWGVKAAKGISMDDYGNGFGFKLDANDLLDDVARSNTVAFYAGSKMLDIFNLLGSNAAVIKLRECVS